MSPQYVKEPLIIRNPFFTLRRSTFFPLLRLLFLSKVILLCPGWVLGQEEQPLSNIVLITLDDLGQEIGFAGDKKARTPFIDSLARSAVNFTNAYVTQSSCSPSRASILTGLYPFQHGQIGLANDRTEFKLNDHITSLPNALRKDGFYSSSIGKVHVKSSDEAMKFDFVDGRTEKTREASHVLRLLNRIYTHESDKYFTMINLYDPHVNNEKSFPGQVNNIPTSPFEASDINPLPYQMVDDDEQLSRIASYYNAVSRADHLIEEIFNFYKESGLLNQTLFIILSDNGAPFNRGKTSNYEAGVKTPMILITPFQSKVAQINELISSIDIMPTILDYANMKIPPMLAGRSLKPIIDGISDWSERPIFTEFHHHGPNEHYPRKAIRFKDWKLIHNLDTTINMPLTSVDGDLSGEFVNNEQYDETKARKILDRYFNPPEFELYDLNNDPHEYNNLSNNTQHNKILRRLKNMLRPRIQSAIFQSFHNLEKPISIFENFLIDSIWIDESHDYEKFEVINRKEIRWIGEKESERSGDIPTEDQFELNLYIKNGYGEISSSLLTLKSAPYLEFKNVFYGPRSRQFLDIYQAKSDGLTPVYFDSHPNGGNISMPNTVIEELTEAGVSVVSWESIPTLRTVTDIQKGWNDANRMLQWVKNNASEYNFDTTRFIIGGSSRGSILSWKIAHLPENEIKGIYMYNALPDVVWQRPERWHPPDEVSMSSPPLFLAYEFHPGVHDAHDPDNGLTISATYDSLGLGDLDTLVHSIGYSENQDKYQFLLNFIQSSLNKPFIQNPLEEIIIDEDQGLKIVELSSVFMDPNREELTFEATDNFEGNVTIQIANNAIEINPEENFNGTGTIALTASNGDYATKIGARVTINAINDAPILVSPIGDLTVEEDTEVTELDLAERFADIDNGDELSLSASSLIPDLIQASITQSILTLEYLPNQNGSGTVVLTATDNQGATTLDTINVTVNPVNDAPISALDFEDLEATEDTYFEFTLPEDLFYDVDGETLTLTSSSLPGWLTFENNIFSGTPVNNDVGSIEITVTATDESNASVSSDLFLSVSNVNDAPILVSPIGDLTVEEDTEVTELDLAERFADIDNGDELSLSASSLIPDLIQASITQSILTLEYLPNQNGSGTVVLTATDNQGATTLDTINVTVNPVNDAPISALDFEDLEATEDTYFEFTLPEDLFYDVDGETLTLSSLPGWLTFENNIFSGTPVNNDVGSIVITVTATDESNASVSSDLFLSVSNVNDAPILVSPIGDLTVEEDTEVTELDLAERFADIDNGDELSLSASSLNPDLIQASITQSILNLEYLPNQNGSGTVVLTATDNQGATTLDTINVTVNPVNDAPISALDFEDLEATEDTYFEFTLPEDLFYDVDGETLTLTSSSLPGWLTFENNIFSGTPVNNDVGSIVITVTATDESNASVSSDLLLSVSNVNDAPILVSPIGDLTVEEDTEVTELDLAERFADIDNGDELSLSASSLNPDLIQASITQSILNLEYLPNQNGSGIVVLTATDNQGATTLDTINVTVNPVNDAPISALDFEDLEATEDTYFEFTLPEDLFYDVDGETLTLTSSSLPGWLTFENNIFSGTPVNNDVGSIVITVTATDESNASVSSDLFLSVSNVNDAPILVSPIGDLTVEEDTEVTELDLAERFADIDNGDELSLSASSLNPDLIQASITQSILNLEYLPNQNGSGTVVLTATDNQGATTLDTINVTVNPVNDAPISALDFEDLEATEDTYFEFTLPEDLFYDVDGETLTLTSSSLPGWLTFENNIFSGTPVNNDVGSIVITVTATDESNASVSSDLFLSVSNVNDAPILVSPIGDLTVEEDTEVTELDLAERFADIDNGDELSLSASSLNPDLIQASITQSILNLEYLPNQNGSGIVVLTATDNQGATVIDTLNVIVTPINDEPRFTLSETTLDTFDHSIVKMIDIIPEIVPIDELDQVVGYSIHSVDPEIATVTVNDQAITVKTITGISGTQSFTIVANDGQIENNQFTVSFDVSVNTVLSIDGHNSALSIYPNPATGQLFFDSPRKLEVQIHSLDGKLWIQKKVIGSIDISSLKAGVYIIQIVGLEKAQSSRILKLR